LNCLRKINSPTKDVKVKTFKHPFTLGYLGELDVIYGDFFLFKFFSWRFGNQKLQERLVFHHF
jgi:hypothetical protein